MEPSKIEKTRIKNRWPIAREGIPFILISAGATLLFFYIGLTVLPTLLGIICLFIIYFFRDPPRGTDEQSSAVLAPADGRILNIQHIHDDNNPFGAPAIKISIFMSVFNVHVNRVPVSGKILEIEYNPGRFFSANMDKASDLNERNRITLETEKGIKIVFLQIAGLIARRIVCWIKEEDFVKAGQRCGLIRFGSRLDIYLPIKSRVTIEKRAKVKAGETIIGYL